MKPYAVLFAAALLAAQPVHAAPVTLSGLSVDFTFDDLQLGLFGTPTVLNDTIYFTPTEFAVDSSNGDGLNYLSATLNIKVTPKAGLDLDGVALSENGDYLLLGALSEVLAGGQLRAFDLAAPAVFETASIVTTPTATMGLPFQDWSGGASIELDTASWLLGGGVNLTIHNALIASTLTPGSLATINKTYVGVSVATSPVPESSKASLMLAGIGLVIFVVRRRARNP